MNWRVTNNPPEIIPLDDLREHASGVVCWCKPQIENGLIVHSALDGREKSPSQKLRLVKHSRA